LPFPWCAAGAEASKVLLDTVRTLQEAPSHTGAPLSRECSSTAAAGLPQCTRICPVQAIIAELTGAHSWISRARCGVAWARGTCKIPSALTMAACIRASGFPPRDGPVKAMRTVASVAGSSAPVPVLRAWAFATAALWSCWST
jgi:hypothetical protein